MGDQIELLQMAQSDLLARALHSGHSDAVGIYHATVHLSLEPDVIFSAIPEVGVVNVAMSVAEYSNWLHISPSETSNQHTEIT